METSRARFIVSTTLGLTAAMFFDRLIARADTIARADLDTLNAALDLERTAIKAYADAAQTNLLAPPALHLAQQFSADHAAHAAALSATVKSAGGVPSDKLVPITYPHFGTQSDVLAFARDLEEKAASTYLSVIPEFKDRNLAGIAGSILGVETVHVGMLANALGAFPPYSGGFVK
ncbi:MAG TPA: ferritin-like domain-containing protein [Candidatus Aquilonibacter sp.]|nr:ferritin-like domain-containing protein [Candidatus Aquilonibacter sp.]